MNNTDSTNTRAPWVIVAGGVNRLGGTDKANFALVEYLLQKDIPVHVVAHRIDEDLLRYPTIIVDRVPVPAGSHFAGEKLLSIRGWQIAKRVTASYRSARVVVNGGNCAWGDINWVHYVHRAWSADRIEAPLTDRLKHRVATMSAKSREITSFRAARLVIANSQLTRRHLIELTNVDPNRVHTIYLGADADWAPANQSERVTARTLLDLPSARPIVTFVGAIGYDHRKGLDILLKAWEQLCRLHEWDAHLVVAGDGRALPDWRSLVAHSDFHERVSFLGYTDKVRELLAASDLLVSPARYESFGLNVQEALCRGVPAIVSAGVGVAEVYPAHLRDLLLRNPEDVGDLVGHMLMWRSNVEYWRNLVVESSGELRAYSWRDMAERFVDYATSGVIQSILPILDRDNSGSTARTSAAS